MERPAKSAAHRVAGLMWAFGPVTIKADYSRHSGAAIGRAVNSQINLIFLLVYAFGVIYHVPESRFGPDTGFGFGTFQSETQKWQLAHTGSFRR